MGRLTAREVENAKPHATKRREISAGHGLYFVIQPRPSGARSWCVRYRHHHRTRKLTLGSADGITLADARVLAAQALKKLASGVDPALEARPRPKPADETFEAVATLCLTREAKRLRSAQRQLRSLERLAFPMLGNYPLHDIRRSDVVRLLDTIEDKNGPVMADMILSTLSKVMRWHARRSDDYACPLVGGMRRSKSKERARDRILDDIELRKLWIATEAPGSWNAFVRFLLLTAARRGEAAGMRHDEISNMVWTCPAERSKTKVAIVRPLSKLAQTALAQAPQIAGGFVFTIDGKKPLNSFGRAKCTLDEASGVTKWTWHDLRRTSRSLMARAGVNDSVAERCLAHTIPGMRAVYDRHEYTSEMLAAYEKLATLIQNIIDPRQKVVPLRA
jgi:integrase